MTNNILLARQPIYDSELGIVAYELLFRSTDQNSANVIDGDVATSQVILNAFTSLPVADILEGKPAYINFTENLLHNPPPLSIEQAVIEVLETVLPTEEILQSLRKLKEQGYQIALDDYVYRPGDEELLRLADIIKIDVMENPPETLPDILKKLPVRRVKMLAEKIETHEVFEQCKQLGFQLFQGYFLAKPELVRGRVLQSSMQAVLMLISALQNPSVQFDELENVFSSDPSLSYKLLRLVNSSAFHLSNKIDTIKRALTILGITKVRSWATLIALTQMSNKPAALCMTAMTRAIFCQHLGTHINKNVSEMMFTVGLLSILDAFLDMPLTEILDSISVSEEIKQSIMTHSGKEGILLSTAMMMERGELSNLPLEELKKLNIDTQTLEADYLDSIRQATETFSELLKQ
jgi:EAL and modified HD-GYP domain-containing signal transduction protein